MSNKDAIIALVQEKGPCLPSDVYRELKTNQLFASAMLGELVSKKLLKVTNLKRGTSPYYYLDDQKIKLQDLVQFLNEKDKIAYDLIKEKLILKDSEQTPLVRISLRTIKDYAVPVQVNHNGESSLFWKWYLMHSKEAEEKIKIMLGIIKPIIKKETKPKKTIQQEPKQGTTLKKEPKPKIATPTPFLSKLTKYFNKNNIIVVNQEIKNRTKTEIDFIIEVPSAFGKLQYYCKAKNKKKINDADIASAYVQGQQKKLPVIILITGDMTKKSQEMLNQEFKGIKVHQI